MWKRWIVALVLVAVSVLGVKSTIRIRPPVGPDKWYPAEPAKLQEAVDGYLAAAKVDLPERRIAACIAPISAYGFSGDVAAHAFKALKPGQYDRVIVLTASHYASFRGCSVPAVQGFQTPLGIVILDGPAIHKLTYCTLITTRSLRYEKIQDRISVHEPEHGIEVLLPFLQTQLGFFKLVPIVVGDLLDYNGKLDDQAVATIARVLSEIIDDRTLVVVGSNFTHHGNAYSYRPFRENVLQGVEQLDQEAFQLILSKNEKGFEEYLERTKNTICGKTAISILLKLLPRKTEGYLLNYNISARKTNDLTNAVGYGALAFVDPTQPPPESHLVPIVEIPPEEPAAEQPAEPAEPAKPEP
ncbi:MAG: hypothetical protein QG656_330, partial [Candidatus Hydrogenedentes bacterium]|nr:hypothetical protein [Candidatus Hydrogenedentota bacterium]